MIIDKKLKNNIIHFVAKIQDNSVVYYDNDWKKKWNQYKWNHEGKNIEMTYEMVDTPEFYQHKYYRGFLLPDIAYASGEADVFKQHIILKRDFLYREVKSGDIEEIPKKHLETGIFIINQINLFDLRKIPFRYIKGIIIVINNEDRIIGYIPSTSKLLYKEMDVYINDCENRLFVDLQGQIGAKGKNQEYAGYVRQLAKSSGSTLEQILKRGNHINEMKIETEIIDEVYIRNLKGMG